ncbi:MAG: [Clostridia bacterium]|nr:[citrate (pro-3S)-lyase] ligase [Clostridia bacterium]
MQNFVEIYAPLTGQKLKTVSAFLESRGLSYENDAEICAVIWSDDGKIEATGSLAGNVLKYIAVSESALGTGACASIVSELVTRAHNLGRKHLFLYTKKENEAMFSSLGFYKVVCTDKVLMMENKKGGIEKFLNDIKTETVDGQTVGAVVANCNPFTNGHLYLIEKAASLCDTLHVFIVSEDRSYFKAEIRYDLAKKCTEHLKNVFVHKSEQYLVSYATFPAYFIKEKADIQNVQMDLDLCLFAKRIAPALNIKKRFVGTEPFCAVTSLYNERMKHILPQAGIEVIETERLDNISASEVRRAINNSDMEKIKTLVPKIVYEYIKSNT